MQALDAADILYCHWKSNEHLVAGLEGDTDVDMLVAHNDVVRCREILQREGWLYSDAPPFSELEHWLGFDVEIGGRYHVHLHTGRLPVGPTKKKFFTLPLSVSDWILSTRVRQDDVWIAAPEAELFMLLLRISLKSTIRNLAGAWYRKRDVMPSKHIRKELDWLLVRIDEQRLSCPALPAVFSTVLKNFLPIARDPKATPLSYLTTMVRIRFLLVPYVTWSRLFARRRKGGKVLMKPTPVFAFVGVDGSGKSSQVVALQKWLRWKLNVQVFYLGSPKKRGVGRLVYVLSRKFPSLRVLFRFYATLYRLIVARRAQHAVARGAIVLTDRYPIPALWKVTDGPRQDGWLHGLEQKLYHYIPDPGALIVLRVSEETLKERDKTISDDSRRKKLAGIDTLDFATTGIQTEVIDGNEEFDVVQTNCRKAVLDILCTL